MSDFKVQGTERPQRVPVEMIIRERLTRWSKRLAEEHATPLLLMGIGHDENSGKINVLTCDEPDITDEVVYQLLCKAASELRQRMRKGSYPWKRR